MATPVTSQVEVRKLIKCAHDEDVLMYITAAESFLTALQVSTKVSGDLYKTIELYTSAHFATISLEGGPLARKTVGDASESYYDVYAGGLMSTKFGQQAVLLDVSGILSSAAANAKNGVNSAQFNVI